MMCQINTINNQSIQVRSCRLVGLRDLAMGTQWVRDKIVDLMNRLVALGVAGFRVDAVKHMYPEDLKYVSDAVNDLDTRWFNAGLRPYVYQEVNGFFTMLIGIYFTF